MIVMIFGCTFLLLVCLDVINDKLKTIIGLLEELNKKKE